MSNFIVPNLFIPGTKAKAQEVNENFSAIKDELNNKCDLGGDSNTTFAVANATNNSHAINKAQAEEYINELKDELVYKLSGFNGHIFAINGNTDSDGKADIVDISGSNLIFKIGTGYKNLEIYTDNTNIEISDVNNYDITGFADGNYNSFIDKEGNICVLNNKIYIQPNQPTLLVNDVWVDTSSSPAIIKQSIGNDLVDFKKVAIGKFTVSSATVSNLQSYPFNSKLVTNANHNSTAEVVETYYNGGSWYRIYSDGWCEQGGVGYSGYWFYFLKPYKDINYTINITWYGTGNYGYYYGTDKTALAAYVAAPVAGVPIMYTAKGYIN